MGKLQQDQDRAKPVQAAIYRRVSTREQSSDGHSLDSQERLGLGLIDREGWTHSETYTDAGYSGADPDRPDLRRLLSDCAGGRHDVVVFSALDRLGRDAGQLRDHLALLDAAHVRPISVNGGELDRETPEGLLQTGILAEFAAFERRKILARATEGIRDYARNTGKPWGEARFPFRRASDGHWEPDPDEVPTARRMLRERVVDGKSYNAIATGLNRDGIPTRRGGNWTATTVRKTVLGKHLIGYFEHGGEWYEGKHDAVVEPAMWETAQALAERGRKFAPSNGGRRPPLHLLVAGMGRCAVCFEALLPRADGDCYLCRTNKQLRGAGACSMPKLDRREIDRQVLAMFEEAFLDLDATRRHVVADQAAQLGEVGAQARRAAKEAGRIATRRAKVEADYLDGDDSLPASVFGPLAAKLDTEFDAATAEADRLRCKVDEIRDAQAELDGEHEALVRLAGLRDAIIAHVRTAEQQADIESLRTAMAQCFEGVYVYPDGRVGGIEPALSATKWSLKAFPIPFDKRSPDLHGTGVPE